MLKMARVDRLLILAAYEFNNVIQAPSPRPTNNNIIENIGHPWKKIKTTIAPVDIKTLITAVLNGDQRSNK